MKIIFFFILIQKFDFSINYCKKADGNMNMGKLERKDIKLIDQDDTFEQFSDTLKELSQQIEEMKSTKTPQEISNKIREELNEEQQKKSFEKPKNQNFFVLSSSSDNIKTFENLIKQFREFKQQSKNPNPNFICYQDCQSDQIKQYQISMNLKSDIFFRLYEENNFDLGISFIQGLFEFLMKTIEVGLIPSINIKDNWIFNAKYYYDEEDKLKVFSPYFLSTKEVNEKMISIAGHQAFKTMKKIFSPNFTCVDIVEASQKYLPHFQHALQKDQNFPLTYDNILQEIRKQHLSINQGQKLIILFLLTYYCYDEITFSKETFKSVSNLLNEMFLKEQFLSDLKEIKNFKKFFLDKELSAGNEISQKNIKDWLLELYGNKNLGLYKKFQLEQKIKKFDGQLDEDNVAFQIFLTKQKDRKLKSLEKQNLSKQIKKTSFWKDRKLQIQQKNKKKLI